MTERGAKMFGALPRPRARLTRQALAEGQKRHSRLMLICITSVLLQLLCNYSPSSVAAAFVFEGSPARITIQPNDLVAIEGESAELNCDAEGEPEPTIDWYHNGELIRSSTQTRTTMGGSIQFLDIRPPAPSINLSAAAAAATTRASSNSQSAQSASQHSDAGTYHCVASNSFGSARSRNATLQVAYIKEEFRITPKDKSVAIGDSVTLDCLPQAWPEPQIKWRHNGRLIEPASESFRLPDESPKYLVNKIAAATPSGNTNTNNNNNNMQPKGSFEPQGQTTGGQFIDLIGSQLVIKQVDKKDEGQYSCLVETKGSHRQLERESPSASLTAHLKPYFIEAPEHKTVQVGGQVRLRCRMGGEPEPVISWRKRNGQPLSEKTQIDPIDKTLILDQVTIADQATYVCEGENVIGSARAMATVAVNSRPKFTTLPSDQEVELGAKVQLRCSGEASPQPMLFWYKEGHRQLMFPPQATSSSSNNLQKNKQLFTPPIPLALTAANGLDTQDWQQLPQAAALVAPAAIDNRYGPSSMVMPQQTSDISPAINRLFSMPVDANQQIFGQGVTENRYVDSQGTLHILNATSSDNGYYACALISPVGSILTKAKVTVKGSPFPPVDHYDPIQDLSKGGFQTGNGVAKFDLLPPPVIKFGSANQTLPTDSSATLNCDVVSQVAYKIQWVFENQPIQEDPPRVTVLESGALNINNLTTGDSGVYTCVVTAANDPLMPLASPFEPLDSSMLTTAPPILQSTSHSSMLKVASVLNPSIPFFRMDPFKYPSSPGPAYLVSTEGNDAIKIAWPAPSDSGSLPINEYIVEHYDTSNEHSGWKVIHRSKAKESLHIEGLSPEGSHFFVIRAANRHGVGPSSAIAGPMRSVAGEARYQAELQRRRYPNGDRRGNFDTYTGPDSRADAVAARDRLMSITTNLLSLTPMSSTSIKLRWATHVNNNHNFTGSPVDSSGGYPSMIGSDADNFVEGFSIRYRATGPGESPLSKEPLFGPHSWGANSWPMRDNNFAPSSLPLVTSFIEGEDSGSGQQSSSIRSKRDLMNIFDYSSEFNEVRVADHTTEHYTINNLRPYTSYQFFVVPYYKDIDGIPSNFLTAQTHEDKPLISPPNLTVRAINDTAVRLLWLHIPEHYTNGILRGYVIQLNRSDPDQQQHFGSLEQPKMISLPLGSLKAKELPLDAHNQRNYVVMYDVTNLTFKSFYSVQVAGSTSVGAGPWSESLNFVMDPREMMSQMKTNANEFSDVISKSLVNLAPQPYNDSTSASVYLIISISLVIASVVVVIGYLLYRRNNQKVLTWKKTISDHFTNKFYMPANVTDPREAANGTMQQNIYDHQQNLIYSGSTHLVQQPIQAAHHQTMWPNGANYVNSSGTGSLSSHGGGGGMPMSTDPNLTRRFATNDRFISRPPPTGSMSATGNGGVQAPLIDQSRPTQIIQHATDYYSVIDDYDTQQRVASHMQHQLANGMGQNGVVDRHQSASSNSDTSCPSSVTRLLPNQNYTTRTYSPSKANNFNHDLQRHEMILQQQVVYSEGREGRPFVTIVNGADVARMATMSAAATTPLSPYATTNLMSQAQGYIPQQHQFQQQQQQQQHQQQQHLKQLAKEREYRRKCMIPNLSLAQAAAGQATTAATTTTTTMPQSQSQPPLG